MKHHQYKADFKFVKEPIEFNKYTDRHLLQYCLGATLYMPAKKNFVDIIMNKKMPGLTSIVMCFEDAIAEEELSDAETNSINLLDVISKELSAGNIKYEDIPLIFFRVRSPEQFKNFTKKLKPSYINIIAGFVFPKFTTSNGYLYLNHLKWINDSFNDILYGMPILESHEIAFKETRICELTGIKKLLKNYREFILNIRVGATDMSSCFGVRRGIDYSIYDILTVRDCLSDILNLLSREDDEYVVSAPVWEYFLADKSMKFSETLEGHIHTSLLKRNLIINEAIDGLLREVIIDRANGFVGKTIIHPTHLKYVNAMQAVTKEEYEDAVQILNTSGGVIKSSNCNKMNEINPHRNWANKIYAKAQVYGVVENESSYAQLFI
ncbi:HpcH/HpaI aldolase/citrate lyase family protein [Tissierella sp. MSJ-40]|uniref:HpcH/HpaI aldolase/citrate lyase family protein n=1 Tax=Tissierella simiarum TaxID=2841534 RepID=A0ABS6E1H2_9FIRM|nr:HpcH/HpaI aldolase/citrate lyase family protein [Tissierella simiarum]MBU5436654.1 HpcH/HpaI aldolase/citrate lyase family protein [Tissierella simiarum]